VEIIDDDEVVQTVTIQIRRVEQADLVVNRVNLRSDETEVVCDCPAANGKSETENQRRQNPFLGLHKTLAG
jgi:hypothetical protein